MRIHVMAALAIFAAAHGTSQAANAITVGSATADPATQCCLAVYVPITGDDNFNATAQLDYRLQGSSTWQSALPLLRVRPDTLSTEDPPGGYGLPDPQSQFAGSIFGLTANTTYEVRITINDPDGGNSTQSLTLSTRATPRSLPATPRYVAVSSKTQLDSALASALPGDVITLAAGTYSGTVNISRSGTTTNPILIHGSSQSTVTIDATGQTYGLNITGDHVYVEDLTVANSDWGAYASDNTDVVIRRNRFYNVNKGIDARSGANYDLYICDNRLEGKFTWPNVSSATWDQEGIAVSGQGVTVCYNTLYGFGDALGLSHLMSIINVAIDFYGNDVLWSGDDGIELDFSHRNVRAFNNRITNSGMGISLQPVWGGPVYVFRNVLVNQSASPFKLNNEPSGFYIFNNTSIRTFNPNNSNYSGYAFPQIGYTVGSHWAYVANFQFKNNLLIGTTGPAHFTSAITLGDIDYNGWSLDGTFIYNNISWSSLANLKASSNYEQHSLILSGPIFQTSLALPSDYTTQWSPLDARLSAATNAIDGGVVLPNITDGYTGIAPDLGAIERNSNTPVYGVRALVDTMPPAAPTGVKAQ